MRERLRRSGRVVAVLVGAFAVGGASAEVAVRTRAAVEQVKRERERGAAGELVALRLTGPDGAVVAQPRLIAPAGKPARLILHPPGRPDEILMSFRVEVARQAGGLLSVHYELSLPDHALLANGYLRLSPGVKQAIHLPQGDLVATWLAVPFPSAQFDKYLEMERAARRAEEGKTS
jgi:hypothetical protein